MQKRCLTLTEIFVIVTTIMVLSGIIMGPWGLGHNHRNAALSASCINNLKQVSSALFQYESPEYYDATPLPVPPASGDNGSNSQTLAPIIAIYEEGLIDNKMGLVCPVYSRSSATSADCPPVAPFNEPGVGLERQIGVAADALTISNKDFVASHYLFTRYYDKKSKSNRVIAGDASGIDVYGKSGFSPNHGFNGSPSGWKTANALFRDGHIKRAAPDFTVQGSIDPTNLWDDIDPPTQTDLTKTQIGHY